ncbi:uncharacterized protein MONOS_14808 [Monocercomonoides exilis]|uniref:uncharacterized protein n=1 Tax=Monocercomonoides exilis TaxID=2049356 RepID=UPI00355A8443|nr:hypothetical protein MONOS_14808 [Monocercomonoides exilis]|eukprot:MONOS_14808.1-p1 / transcript=MONOS_14808.1 / gene=MONOS_14808 / organism=Monocercomonoides_exilis_PA203 / gene_product=unspecified product / transcript_product=unspecified product / location=Mono_scaffold01077:14224-14751(-) / protein_length=176 / sequence_SO=supercontig / SO=protein_coding / is_pseudo=false
MVWRRQSNCRRCVDSSLKLRVYSRSSTDTSDSDGNMKGSDGENSSDYIPAELEVSGLEHFSSNEQLLQLGIELHIKDSSRGDMDEEDGTPPSSKEDENSHAQFIKKRCEAWWLHALYERGVFLELAEECKACIAQATSDGYLFCIAHFADQWKKCAHEHIQDNIPEWTFKCADVF